MSLSGALLSNTVLSNLVAIRHMWRQTSVKKWIPNDKYTAFSSIFNLSGDNKACVATIVATERIWLDTTGLIPQSNICHILIY